VHELVDTRRAQAHRRRDLAHRQTGPMRRADGSDSLRLGRLEPLGHDAEAVAHLLLPRLETVPRLFRGVHHPQDAKHS
jgi:hypothetical protein